MGFCKREKEEKGKKKKRGKKGIKGERDRFGEKIFLNFGKNAKNKIKIGIRWRKGRSTRGAHSQARERARRG